MKRRARLIFKEYSEVAFGAVCVRNFWYLQAKHDGNSAEQTPTELHYASLDEDLRLIYVEDPIADCSYVIVSGAEMNKACAIIRKKLPIWSDAELFESWHQAPHDSAQIAAILRIGVAAPSEYDETFAALLKEGLGNQDAAVREAALAGIGYTQWPEFDDELKKLAANDTDERCRKRAKFMLEVRARERAKPI